MKPSFQNIFNICIRTYTLLRHEIRKIFRLLGVSDRYLDAALSALKVDSQKGYFGSRGQGKRSQKEDKIFWQLLDEEFEGIGIPIRHTDSFEKFKETLLSSRKWMK